MLLSPGSGVAHICGELPTNKHHPSCLRHPKQLCFYRKASPAPLPSLQLDFTDSISQGSWASPALHGPLPSTASTTETWAVLQHAKLVYFQSNTPSNNNISSFQAACCLLGKTRLSYWDGNLLHTWTDWCYRGWPKATRLKGRKSLFLGYHLPFPHNGGN